MSMEQIINEALKLSPEDRVKIAELLYDSIEDSEDDPQLKALLDRRWEEIVTGKVKTIPWEQTLAKARAALKKQSETDHVPSRSR